MSVAELLETAIEAVTRKRDKAKRQCVDAFNGAVMAGADGETPPDLDEILDTTGHTPQQYREAVYVEITRRDKVPIAARVHELEKERDEAANKLGPLRDALAKATREYQAAQAAYNLRDGQLRMEIAEAREAVAWLRANRPDPRRAELLNEKVRLEGRRSHLTHEIGNGAQGLRGRLNDLQVALKRGPQIAQEMGVVEFFISGGVFDEAALRNSIYAVEAEIRGRETELANINERLSIVSGELDDIEQNQLAP